MDKYDNRINLMAKQLSERKSFDQSPQGSVTEHAGLPEVRLPIGALDLETGLYCTSYGEVPDALRESILKIGIINPPLVHRNETGSRGWDVVTGFRRLRVLCALGCETCQCRDLGSAPRPPLELLLMGFCENLSTRRLNEVEKAMALSRLSTLVPRKALLEEYMPLLGLPSRPDLLNSYMALNTAEAPVRKAVAGGRLSMRGFEDLQAFSPDDRVEVVKCIDKLNFNFNNQIQFINIICDLIKIKGAGAREILSSEPFCSTLSQANINVPQAGSRLLDLLRRLRFPSLEKAERVFRERVKRLAFPPGIQVHHPPYFEGPHFRLEITFQNGMELRDRLSRLSAVKGLESLGPPWETGGE